MIESINAYALGDVYKASGVGVGGVLGGFMVRCIPGTNRVQVGPGVAVIPTTPDDELYDPLVLWVEQRELVEIDLTSQISGGNPRLITIEVAAAEVDKVTEVRSRFNTTTGTFDSVSVPIVKGSEPVFYATAGAAAANPVVAGGTEGRLPLAVVKLTAGQANFLDEFASVLMCRPMLAALGDRLVPRDYVRGGGISVGQEAAGVIGNLTRITVHACSLNMLGLEADVGGTFDVSFFGRTIDGTTIASLTAAIQPVYAYAAPPPWMSDYGNIAPREAWQRNPNEVSQGDDHSIVNGQGGTFKSLVGQASDTVGRNLKNAIVIFDDQPPWGADDGLSGGAPVRIADARGPHPETAPGGSGSITLDDTQDPSWGSAQVIAETVYLGSVSSIGTSNFVAQAYVGHGEVLLIDEVDLAAMSGRRPALKETGTQALTDFFPGHYPDMLSTDDPIIPDYADVYVGAVLVTGNAGGTAFAAVGDAFGFGSPDGASIIGRYTVGVDTTETKNVSMCNDRIRIARGSSGEAVYQTTSPGGSFALTIWLRGWHDHFLADR